MKKFKSLFENYIEISKIPDSMVNLDIESLSIDKKNRKLSISLISENDIPEKDISACKKAITSSNLGLISAEISIKKANNNSTENIDIQKIIESFVNKSVTAKRIFKDFKFSQSENEIKITLFHGGRDFLVQKNIGRELSLLLSQKMGKTMKVVFTQSDNLNETKKETQIIPEKTTSVSKEPEPETTEEKTAEIPEIEVRTGENLLPKISVKTATPFFGKLITKNPISIREINPQMTNATIWGDVFMVDFHETKDGKSIIYSIYITDYTGSIVLKLIENKSKAAQLEKIKKNMSILVEGTVSEDKYERELVIRPKNINLVSKYKVVDKAPKKRVELHLHTNMSAMDGINPASDFIKRAAEWGHTAVAITDHGIAQAYPEAMNTANEINKNGGNIKIIYGVEAYFVNDMLPIVTGDYERGLDGEFICFDLETTGLNANLDKIIEIGAFRVKNKEILDKFSIFVDPEIIISEKTTELTSITPEMLSGAPKEKEAIKKFIEFCGEKPVLVAHNANFDVSFIKAACERLNIKFDFTYVDSVPMSRALIMNAKNHKLDTIAKILKIPEFHHHRACDDAKALAYIFIKLLDMANTVRDVTSLQQINTKLSGSNAKKSVSHHMTILVKNQKGLKNLYKLISMAHLDYFYKKPRIPKSELLKHREGLIIGSACEASELFRGITGGRPFEDLLEIAKIYDYLEIQPLGNNSFMILNEIAKNEEQLQKDRKSVV